MLRLRGRGGGHSTDPALELNRLQAWHFLRQNGEQPAQNIAKHVLGVVVEVRLPEGLDVLAAYPNHSARYYHHSGAAVIWDHPDESLDAVIDQLFAGAREIVARIGPWKGARPPAPPRDHARLSFLTPSGLHFGEGSIKALSGDPLAGRVLQPATALMSGLIAKRNAR